MSSSGRVMVIVEGRTEQIFIREILAPYLGAKGVFLRATVLSKSGQKGGDVRFVRARKDIAEHLKQDKDVCVSLLVDYYGIGKDWPGLKDVRSGASPTEVAATVCSATQSAIDTEFAEQYRSDVRFVPNIAVHEFEALLFSDPVALASEIKVKPHAVEAIVQACGEPEAIDNSRKTAPSKRIEQLYARFKKTTNGIEVARKIGIDRMRSRCPVFDSWLLRLESLTVDRW